MKPVLAALALAALLAGCFGYPPGSVHVGDSARIRYTAEDPATGQPIGAATTVTVQVGLGGSGLGPSVEQALLGKKAGDEVTVDSPAGERPVHDQVEEVDKRGVPQSLVWSMSWAEFEANFGGRPSGTVFPVSPIFNATVLSSDDAGVTFRVLVADGLRIPQPDQGVVYRYDVDGDNVTVALEPLSGARFAVEAPDAFGRTKLNLPPGNYTTVGETETAIEFARTDIAGIGGRDVRLRIEVLEVVPHAGPLVTGDGPPRRHSPQVGPAGTLTRAGPTMEPGHGHEGAGH